MGADLAGLLQGTADGCQKENVMPWINGRFYANALFGRALERAREASLHRSWG